MVFYHIGIEVCVFAIDECATGTLFVGNGKYISVDGRVDMSHHDDGVGFADCVFHEADVGLNRTSNDVASFSDGACFYLAAIGSTDKHSYYFAIINGLDYLYG